MKIDFGKHKGTEFNHLPISYMRWLAEKEIVVRGFDWSKAARRYMSDHNLNGYISIDEREALADAERAQAAQDAEDDEDMEVSWTASTGQHIRIERGIGQDEHGIGRAYEIYVDGRKLQTVFDIVDLPQSPAPGIVARVGKIGLTAERRDALKKMMEN